jgi:hypothetical protein
LEKDGVNYIAFYVDIFFNQESELPIKEQIVRNVIISSILKRYEHDDFYNYSKFFEQEKNNFKDNNRFVILFDTTCTLAIMNNTGNDITLFLGADLIKVAIIQLPN